MFQFIIPCDNPFGYEAVTVVAMKNCDNLVKILTVCSESQH